MTDTPGAPPPAAPAAPETPATPEATGTAPAPPRAGHREKLPLYLILGGIVAFMAFVLWSVRDNQSAADLAAGTCFDLPGRDVDISTVTRHDCAQPHDAEAFHVAEFTGDSYPISLSLDSFIEDTCVPAFATYVGEPLDGNTELTIGYFYPNRSGWDNGDRTVTCYVARQDEAKLSQSVKTGG